MIIRHDWITSNYSYDFLDGSLQGVFFLIHINTVSDLVGHPLLFLIGLHSIKNEEIF